MSMGYLGTIPIEVYSEIVIIVKLLIPEALDDIPVNPSLEGLVNPGENFPEPAGELGEVEAPPDGYAGCEKTQKNIHELPYEGLPLVDVEENMPPRFD